MDQTPFFQPQLDTDFFQSFQFPSTAFSFSDVHDPFKRKLSWAGLESPSLRFRPNPYADFPNTEPLSFLLHQRDDDHHFSHPGGAFPSWQAPHVHNLLDLPLDSSLTMKDNDLGMDNFQIRSRGGSFNFGRMRRDSEDLFQGHSDLFKHIKNMTDRRPLHQENVSSMRKQSQQILDLGSPRMPVIGELDGSLTLPPNAMMSIVNLSELEAKPLSIGMKNTTDSTVETTDGGDIEEQSSKKGKKKIMLNDRSEKVVEEKEAGNVKNNVKETKVKTKLQKTKSKPVTAATKIEESAPILSDLKRMDGAGKVEEIFGGFNFPEDVKEYLKNSNVMTQIPWLENKKIGTLTVAERKVKIEKYLEKRKKRSWSRRINYDCRKRVADSRLRIKGRFVTRDQAFVLLRDAGISFNPETITNDDIKELLTDKSKNIPAKPKSKEGLTGNLKRPYEDNSEDESDLDD